MFKKALGCLLVFILVWVILVVGVGIVVYNIVDFDKEPKIMSSYIEDVSFDEIYRAYKENELRADDTYKNNRYIITAKVNGMATGGLFNLTGGATLTMEKRVGNTIVFFHAEFEKDQEDNLKQINVGDTITFGGECLSVGSWIECEIITE